MSHIEIAELAAAMNKRLYAAAIAARNLDGIHMAPLAFFAHNEADAYAIAMRITHELCPPDMGWLSHQVSVLLVPIVWTKGAS